VIGCNLETQMARNSSRSENKIAEGDLLRFLVFGAGALGTYVGGSLAMAGHELVFLERPEVVDALRTNGLHIELFDKNFNLSPLRLASSIEEALSMEPYTAAIFALKSYDTEAAVADFTPYSQSLPPILCLQNGVENEAALSSVLGADRVIAGTVTSAIQRNAAGDISLQRLRGMGVADGHLLSIPLVKALNLAGLQARLFSSAADMKWSKMLTNLLANASSAILNMTPAEIFSHPGLFNLEIAQLREALAVMRAENIHVVDLPATPVRLLAFSIRYLPSFIARPLLRRAVGGGRGGKMPSFHIDLYAGRRKSEVDYLNGAVVRYASRSGMKATANRMLNETLLALARQEIPLDTFARQPEKLLVELQKYRQST
jgi:2-dehydropantoate 2-reductase